MGWLENIGWEGVETKEERGKKKNGRQWQTEEPISARTTYP
jgi:hypothetical protein